jgi:subtilisin family serine protease
MVRAILYVTGLKTSGALGDSPLVINLSNGLHRPLLMERAAIDYAIANGVIVVAAAGNEGAQGMRSPGRYAEVISVASSGWDASFPADDPTYYRWIGRDLPEGLSGHHVSPTSSRALPGQDLDVVAPGLWVPVPYTVDGKEDYSFVQGTSHSAPRVAGLIALMLQKNPNLDQAAVEAILESTATPLAPACADIQWPTVGPGNSPVWGDDDQVSFFTLNTCWDASATGAGVTLADMVLAGTPLP